MMMMVMMRTMMMMMHGFDGDHGWMTKVMMMTIILRATTSRFCAERQLKRTEDRG